MKISRKQTTLLAAMLVMASIGAIFAQNRILKIVTDGEVVFSYPADKIEFMTIVSQLDSPTDVKAEAGENSITVSWNAVPGAEAYVVSRSGDGAEYTELAQVSTTSYVDSNPLQGKNYYGVRAVGTGMVSSEESYAPAAVNFGQPDTPAEPENPSHNGHEYVDLGLDSGLMWATCNIGASSPSEYGDYYAWGETTTKTDYTENTSIVYGKTVSELQSSGIIDSNGNLTAQYDAASANWGGSWRLPTMNEIRELLDSCKWTWTTVSGTNGYKVTGPNGNTIFLPAAGWRYASEGLQVGSSGIYSSSTIYGNDDRAYTLDFYARNHSVYNDYCYFGQSLRPVQNYKEPIVPDYNGHDYVDLGLPSGLKWATCNIGASSPSEYGGYYAWGETTTKADYSESTSITYEKTIGELRSNGIIDSNGNLTAQYDAASANWGGTWRLPTKAECEELLINCSWTCTTISGSNGYKVTGPNGSSIFLPAAGLRRDSDLILAGTGGEYWSGTVYNESYANYKRQCAYKFLFDSDNPQVGYFLRFTGHSLRPVSE